MGTLRCTDWIETEDGTRTSAAQGLEVKGVVLGEPNIVDDVAEFIHERFPNGTINKKGKVTLDEE